LVHQVTADTISCESFVMLAITSFATPLKVVEGSDNLFAEITAITSLTSIEDALARCCLANKEASELNL